MAYKTAYSTLYLATRGILQESLHVHSAAEDTSTDNLTRRCERSADVRMCYMRENFPEVKQDIGH
jgi:hypothetical protein